ncbi:50S ribosomal protein L5 [Candidatus Woesearchaeota archaeon]|nr:50S ribosomal protein L5 [Candidatus Woesearchaeota archaeon]
MNPMKSIKVEKVTLNIGAGKDQTILDKGVLLLKAITSQNPIKTKTAKRIPEWGLRPGLPIGCKVTIRGKKAYELLARLLDAREFRLMEKQFTDEGNLSFGIPEYIDIPGMKYDPKIGVIGLEVCVTLERPGFRIKRRWYLQRKVPKGHRIGKVEAMQFMKERFNAKIGEAA